MAARKKIRVAWILNHTTLLEFEAKLLIHLGCEVFVPKVLPGGLNSRTAVVTAQYDETLSVPQSDLEVLNRTNFYDGPISSEAAQLLNRHFDVLFVPYVFPGAYFLSRAFKGTIVLRVFGHVGEYTYQTATQYVGEIDYNADLDGSVSVGLRSACDFVTRVCSKKKLQVQTPTMISFYQARHRIYLGSAYESVIRHEPEFFQSRSLFLPLGIPDSITKLTDTFRGGNGQVMFVCPNINDIPLYRGYYEDFVRQFGDLPYVIAGKQNMGGDTALSPISDPKILGYQTREELDALMQSSECMFYHSREPRHLHYHPVEAMAVGLPVIFMSGGVLEELGGCDQPGLCYDHDDARLKMERLLNGDRRLRASIQKRQKSIVEKFSYEFCLDYWKKNFVPLLEFTIKPQWHGT